MGDTADVGYTKELYVAPGATVVGSVNWLAKPTDYCGASFVGRGAYDTIRANWIQWSSANYPQYALTIRAQLYNPNDPTTGGSTFRVQLLRAPSWG